MPTDDFFRARLDQMIDLRPPLAVLASRLPWVQIEAALAPAFARKNRRRQVMPGSDLFGTTLETAGAGVSAASKTNQNLQGIKVLLSHFRQIHTLGSEKLINQNIGLGAVQGGLGIFRRAPTPMASPRKLICVGSSSGLPTTQSINSTTFCLGVSQSKSPEPRLSLLLPDYD